MACTVTINDIQKEIKYELLDTMYQGHTAKPIQNGQAVFLDNISEATLESLLESIDQKYGSKYYGSVVNYTPKDSGYVVNINPSQQLADAMSLQNERDEAGAGSYRFQSRENTEGEFKYTEPVGDNYTEFVNWKEAQLEDIQKRIHKQKVTIRTQDTSHNRSILKQLEREEIRLNNQLTKLKEKKIDFMLHAVYEDMRDIEAALNDSTIHNIEEIRNRLRFYETFQHNLKQYGEEFKEISSSITSILGTYDDKRVSKLTNMLESDISIKETLKTLNKNKDLKKQFGKETDENGDLEDFTIDDLLVAVSDIGKLDMNYLGLISSTTGDTVLPQFLMKEFRSTLFKKQTAVAKLMDKLDSFVERTGIKERDFLISKDKDGKPDGFLVDVFSMSWFKEQKTLFRKVSEFRKASKKNRARSYIQVKNWYDKNAHVIDFTKLSAVKAIYSANPEYADYFKHSDAAMQRYEENLKMQLGPRYDSIVETLLNKLEKLEEFKEDNRDSPYYERNLAQRDLWRVLELWNKKSTAPISYNYTTEAGKTFVGLEYFSHFQDLPILPLSEVTDEFTGEKVSSGYYNPNFDIVKRSPEYSELWSIFKEMAEYIDSRYELENGGRISYPKIEATYAERIMDNWTGLKRGGNRWKNFKDMFHDTLHEYKGFFYEKGEQRDYSGGVVSNYSDRSVIEIRELTKVYQLKGMSYEDAKAKATGEILVNYSTDIDRNFKALLLEAALHDTRLTVEPIAKAILESHKAIKTEEGKDRENSIKRLEHFIEKIVLNQTDKQRGTKSVAGKNLSEGSWLSKLLEFLQRTPGIKKFLESQSTRLLTDQEKNIVKHFKSLKGKPFSLKDFSISDMGYNLQALTILDEDNKPLTSYGIDGKEVSYKEFNEAYQNYIDTKIKETGLDLNLAGFIDGVLKTIVLKGLGINPISGIFNRIEGMHTVMIMDATGDYWRPGNADSAKDFLAFANIIRMSDRFTVGKYADKKKQLEIFERFLQKADILQNKKDELQKSAEDSKDLSGWIFKWAVDNPEFKNQGSVILSVLMDEIIVDDNGNKHFFFDKETQSFSAFELENGILKLKPEFSKFSLESEQMSNLIFKLETTVSHSQGNYNAYDIMRVKKDIWGRAFMLFRTWLPEHLRQRWGITTSGDNELNINLAHTKQARNGRFIEAYKSSKGSFAVYTAAALGISYAGLGLMGLGVTGIVGAYVFQKFLRKVSNKQSIQRDSNTILEMLQFMHSTLIESLNYPSRLLSSVPGVKKARINTTGNSALLNAYKNSNMTMEEINSLRAMSRELAIMLTFLSLKLMTGALMWDDDDDEKSPQRRRFNFVQNQLSRSITTLNSWTNLGAFIRDNQRIGAVAFILSTADLVRYIMLDPDMDKAQKAFLDLTPIPRLITKTGGEGLMPWEDKKNFDELADFAEIPIMKWVAASIKDFKTNGEKGAKKEYTEIRDRRREELQEQYMPLVDGDKEKLKIIVDNLMREEIGDKEEEASYVETIEQLQEEGSLDTREARETIVEKMKEEGLSDSEIGDYMREIYSE